MCVWDPEELVDGEPSPIAPSDSAGARRCEIEVESDVTVLLLHKDSVRSVTIKRTWCKWREGERVRHTGLTEG